jgi:hypothetical protein
MAKETKEAVRFKPFALRFEFHDPEETEIFLRGCILAMQNNNSHLWSEVIDGINSAMMPYRAAKLKGEMDARAAAGMP